MYLRVSLTDRCNLRCAYCLPESAHFAATHASADELQRLMRIVAQAVAIHKIRLTGGEPTLCRELLDHVRHAKTLAPRVVMTSNGVLLPPLLAPLRQAGLDRVTISLDSVDPEHFQAVARRDELPAVLTAIRSAQACGFTPLKINCVALQGTDFPAMVRFAIAQQVHLRFIELMAIGEARATHAQQFIAAEAQRERLREAGFSLRERCDLDEPTSRVWSIDGVSPEATTLGFITTVTQPFCATCDRLRLTSQGRFYTCLMDDVGVDLLTPLRRGQPGEAVARVRLAVAGKRPPELMERVGVMADIGG